MWVGYYNTDGALQHFMTSKPTRDYYFMYKVNDDGSFTKLGKAKSPPDLEKRYNVCENIGISI